VWGAAVVSERLTCAVQITAFLAQRQGQASKPHSTSGHTRLVSANSHVHSIQMILSDSVLLASVTDLVHAQLCFVSKYSNKTKVAVSVQPRRIYISYERYDVHGAALKMYIIFRLHNHSTEWSSAYINIHAAMRIL